MARAENEELVEQFEQFYRRYYSDEIGELARRYPREQKSLHVDWDELYQFDPDVAEDYLAQPDQLRGYAEEALRLYDLPVDVSLGQAHVRLENVEATDIRELRSEHVNTMVAVTGMIRKATDVRPKVQQAAFECQRCGTLTRVPQSEGTFQEPHECEGCERQGPFKLNVDQSEFVDAQKLRVQESPEGLRGGETPQSVDIHVEDDLTGNVTPGDHVTVTGVLRLDQQGEGQDQSPIFDIYMDGRSVTMEDEEYEDMDIRDEDKAEIVELSQSDDIYEQMVDSIAPTIHGYRQEKLAIVLQLFSGVTKEMPDGSRIRGDLHILLIGDPGTGKCVAGDTTVTLDDGSEMAIRDLVEKNLDDPTPVDDGVYAEVDIPLPTMDAEGGLTEGRATKVWKREAPEQMYRIRTASGRKLTVTPSHPLFVQDGGPAAVRAEDIEVGEFVATPRELRAEGEDALDVAYRRSRVNNAVRLDAPDELTPWLARLLGYVVAEGYVQRADSGSAFVSVTNNDREILDDVADALDRLGLNHSERGPHEGKDAHELLCSSSEFVSFLEGIEPALLEGSAAQRVPDAVMGATPPVKRAFLRAYVDGEGAVSSSQREVVVASTNRELLTDVRHLLLASGVQSQLHERANGSFRLRISGADFDRYVERIEFVTERKSDAAAAHDGTASNTNTDVVPDVGSDLRRVRESLGLAQSECGLPRSTYQHYERGDRNPSRESLRTVVERFEAVLADNESPSVAADGARSVADAVASLRSLAENDLSWDRVETVETVEPEEEWVYDLEVARTHTYLSNGVVSHNSQILQYIKNVAPRSVYTSGKGSSAAGLTAAAVRDDFGDGDQWSLEAGALVLADKGTAAVDELDKMRPEDQSAMHQALEQQEISISKAGINATLKSRCSLLGAANPTYGRFDIHQDFSEQIDLAPPLITRFDLIFTITDRPDEEEDRELAQHILETNYAGELHTHRQENTNPSVSEERAEAVLDETEPAIDPDLMRKYIAFTQRTVFPTMTEEAREVIEEFYVDLRAKGMDEGSPVPVTARKLEALVRLAEASARVRLSDTVERKDAERVTEIVHSSLQDIGVDPETGEFDADIVETGTSKSQRDRIRGIKDIIDELQSEFENGAPLEEVLAAAEEEGMERSKAEHEIESLKQKGEIYQPSQDHLRTL